MNDESHPEVPETADDDARLAALRVAKTKAFALLSVIEDRNDIQSGLTKRQIELDNMQIARDDFGIELHWHKGG